MRVIPLVTVNAKTLETINGIELTAEPKIVEGGIRVSVEPPIKKGVFSHSTFLRSISGYKTGTAIEIMFGENGKNSSDSYTRTFYEYYNLPNFVNIVAFVKIQEEEECLIGVRPVTPIKRTRLCREIENKKRLGDTKDLGPLVENLRKLRAGSIEDLFPFVFQLYPVGGKIMRYKIFAVGVATSRNKTAFEVITNKGNNFLVEVTNKSEINLRNRNDKLLFGNIG
jgi:hypothetical protein